MSTCAKAVVQGDGSYLLAIDPAITDTSTCAYIVESGSDSSAWRELGNMNLTDAGYIGSMVGVVWAIAWAFRAISKTLSISEGFQNE